jgi:DNA-binding CsgD family transcriptional regulator
MRYELSDREMAVVSWAAKGLVDKQIADEMRVSVATIRTYWDRVRRKTNGLNKTHCVVLVVTNLT